MLKDKYGNKYYKLALHIHTTLSDGRKTPEEVAREYKADGYDALAITDHWVYHEGCDIEGLHIIPGCEYNLGVSDTIDGVMHIVGLFMKHAPDLKKGEETRESVTDGIIEADGIPVLAHPAWSLNTPEDARALPKIHFTEIYNAVSEAHNSERAYSDYFAELMANEGRFFGLFAVDDAHFYDGSDNRRGFVMVKADELSDEALAKALIAGDFYASQGPEIYARIEGAKFIIDTTEAELIATFSNRSYCSERAKRKSGATHFEYEIRPDEKWLRAMVRDKAGRCAWTNFFVLKQD